MKLLEENRLKWPSIIEEVLFAHRVSKQSSTKYSPFKLQYNWEQVLLTDVKYKLSSTENSDPDESFDKDIFDTVFASSNIVRQAGKNINSASSASNDVYIGVEVLLRNNKWKDRKDGTYTFKWLVTNVVSDITNKSLVTLKNKNDKGLKKV